MYKFAPAAPNEAIAFGAARPGYSDAEVNEWLAFMQRQGIQRICCLLPDSQLAGYSNLLNVYRHTFGGDRVCWAPIEDFHLVESSVLIDQILPFLLEADRRNQKVVVHCAGGIGRTGHILAAWLIAGRGFPIRAAIASVKQTGRNPDEAVIAAPFQGRNPWKVAAELDSLLKQCQRIRGSLT